MSNLKNLFTCCFNNESMMQSYLSQNFMFSENPNKFAITIGINYSNNNDSSDDLLGCINDLDSINTFLLEKCHFSSSNIHSLCDSDATKENIENAINEMVRYSKLNPNSELWFSFSGHGVQKNSIIEQDGKTEYICPSDYKKNGLISDDWLNFNLLNKLPNSTNLFILMDCCHSGSNFDIQYQYKDKKFKSVGKPLLNNANVIKLSGSEDNQTSADYYDNADKKHQGALTNAFLDTNNDIRLSNFLKEINKYLKNKYFTQNPVLSISDPKLVHWYLYNKDLEIKL